MRVPRFAARGGEADQRREATRASTRRSRELMRVPRFAARGGEADQRREATRASTRRSREFAA
jgi:hypothetical protein